MSSVPPGARRSIWLCTIDVEDDGIAAFEADLARYLGAEVEADGYEIFRAGTLEDYSLSRYLTDAHGMDEGTVTADAAKLDALTGYLLLVHGNGLAKGATEIRPMPPLTLVGQYAARYDFSPQPPLESEAATGPIGDAPQKVPSKAAMSGRIAMYALLAMFALVGLMIWVAG